MSTDDDAPNDDAPNDDAGGDDGVEGGEPEEEGGNVDGTDDVDDRSGSLGRRLAVAAVLTAVALAAGWYLLLRDEGGLPADAVLSVDGRTMSEDEFSRRVDLLTALYGLQPPSPDAAEYDRFRRDSAKSFAVGIILENEAADRGLELAERTVSDAFARYIEQQYPVGGRSAFVQALGNVGVSEAEVLAEFRRTLFTRMLYNDVVETAEVSDEDLVAEYEARKEDLGVSETRALRHLVVSTEEAAQAAKARITGGEDFAAVAGEVSLDGATAAEGGDLGVVSADMLDPAFGEPAFSALPGTVFGPVRTDLGWYLGIVEEIYPPQTPTLDDIAEQLRTRIRIERELEQWRQFLEAAIAEADTDYADDYRPENPDAPPPVVLPDPLSPSASPPSTTAPPAPESTDDGG